MVQKQKTPSIHELLDLLIFTLVQQSNSSSFILYYNLHPIHNLSLIIAGKKYATAKITHIKVLSANLICKLKTFMHLADKQGMKYIDQGDPIFTPEFHQTGRLAVCSRSFQPLVKHKIFTG